MNEYIERLVRCGYAHYTAHNICHSFMRELGLKELQEFVESIEKDNNVCGSDITQIPQAGA